MPLLLLILEPRGQRASRTPAQVQECWEQMLRFGQALQQQGLLLASESLSSHVDATRVQVRGGQVQAIDGPFAAAKEMVGGYFLLDTDDGPPALDIAARCLAARWAPVLTTLRT